MSDLITRLYQEADASEELNPGDSDIETMREAARRIADLEARAAELEERLAEGLDLCVRARNLDSEVLEKSCIHPWISDQYAKDLSEWETRARAALSGDGSAVLASPFYRHRKGGTYRVIAQGRIEADLTPATIYESLSDGSIWVRPTAEFQDGRFTALENMENRDGN